MKRTFMSLAIATIITPLTLGIAPSLTSPARAATPTEEMGPDFSEDPDISPEKEAVIQELIEATNEQNIIVESMRQGLEENPQIPQEAVDEYLQRLEVEYVNLATPIYAEHYNMEELQAMLTFYQSDVGQSIAARSEDVARDSFERVSSWTEMNMRQIMEDMGY
ncbi:DUF2059 domain-containing protein [Geitlerinema sp. P-1104]|uniref:DUF2059 domain-containing protein n=1 Tax=Geitlerinema sp. P-1104 TaxID=2546230 RepID=UPI0014776A6A|nr:DUF2059 domain-containing protein [Geitlerinema sp. P-1104]